MSQKQDDIIELTDIFEEDAAEGKDIKDFDPEQPFDVDDLDSELEQLLQETNESKGDQEDIFDEDIDLDALFAEAKDSISKDLSEETSSDSDDILDGLDNLEGFAEPEEQSSGEDPLSELDDLFAQLDDESEEKPDSSTPDDKSETDLENDFSDLDLESESQSEAELTSDSDLTDLVDYQQPEPEPEKAPEPLEQPAPGSSSTPSSALDMEQIEQRILSVMADKGQEMPWVAALQTDLDSKLEQVLADLKSMLPEDASNEIDELKKGLNDLQLALQETEHKIESSLAAQEEPSPDKPDYQQELQTLQQESKQFEKRLQDLEENKTLESSVSAQDMEQQMDKMRQEMEEMIANQVPLAAAKIIREEIAALIKDLAG